MENTNEQAGKDAPEPQKDAPEPQWEQCPYCSEYHPVGTSEQCPAKL